MEPISDDPSAPFGTAEDGTPIAPFGLKVDGTPRRSNRGAKAGAGRAGGPPRKKPATSSPRSAPAMSGQDRKEMLLAFNDMFVVNGLVGAALAPVTSNYLGPDQAAALAGDAVIMAHFAPPLADGLIALAEVKPGLLSWMDGMAEKAPYLLLVQTGVQITKALVGNHIRPNRDLANAGIRLAAMNAARMAEEVQREADAMGIPKFEMPDAQPEPAAA